jgi:carbamoyl-phosphate synthase large subunit
MLDLLSDLNGHPYALEILTGRAAQSEESFRRVFEQESGLAFTPRNFRRHRCAQLDRADAMIVVRTGLSESSAFEVAYNVFAGRKAPIFFAVWRQAPIKTTLLRELDELTTVQYVDFDHPRELKGPLLEFFQRLALQPEPLLANSAAVCTAASPRDPHQTSTPKDTLRRVAPPLSVLQGDQSRLLPII